MGLIENLLKRVEEFNDGLKSGKYMQEIVVELEPIICDMNSELQLYEQGITSTGIRIADYAPYSPYTVAYKKAMGQPYNRVTLRDEGDFYRSFFVDADGEKFTIKANDWKAESLAHHYGDDIMGLTDENKEVLANEIYPELLTLAKKIIYDN